MDILSAIGNMLEKGLWAGAVVLIVVVMMERVFKERQEREREIAEERVGRERQVAEERTTREKEVAADIAAFLERCRRREDVLIEVVKENTDTMASIRTLIDQRIGKVPTRKKTDVPA